MDNLAFALENGLTKKEFNLIVNKLKREPNKNEIGVIAAMWSEHCSYKSSKFYLKKLPTKGRVCNSGSWRKCWCNRHRRQSVSCV